jgi:hypothetical protein
MQGDSVHAVEGLSRTQRIQGLRNKATKLRTIRDQLSRDLGEKEREIATLSARQEVLTKVSQLFRVLMDRMIMGQVKIIEQVITEGLRTIFYDQDLSFRAELSSKYNKVSAEFFICSGDPDNGGIKGSPLDSFGGGPSSLASLILRVLTLIRLNKGKILLLDETLNAISDDYIENTGLFLKSLAETTGIQILMITHKLAYLDNSVVAYQCESRSDSGRSHLVAKRLRGPK